MSSAGSDAKISGSKIEPLDSDQKEGVSRDESGGGAAGTDISIDQARIDPVGGKGQGQGPEPRADSKGVVGREADVSSSKIDPLIAQGESEHTKPATGLKDEEVSAARIEPLGSVREDGPKR